MAFIEVSTFRWVVYFSATPKLTLRNTEIIINAAWVGHVKTVVIKTVTAHYENKKRKIERAKSDHGGSF
jgi:ornithine cyclodeaminase/alanine dehydrogenase-like protein (mu-crystallin family)